MNTINNISYESISLLYGKNNKTFNKWLSRVFDTVTPWTENEITYFRKAVGSSSSIKDDTLRRLLMRCFAELGCEYSITQEQTKKGIDYLMNTCFKKNGEQRNSLKSQNFGYREKAVITTFSHFKFVGLYLASSNSYEFYIPIYRVYSSKGEYFDYTTNMGNMEVIG